MYKKKKVLIVGTGLSAYGACKALLEKENIEVDVSDIGLTESYKDQPNYNVPNSKDIDESFFPYGINDKRWSTKLFSKRICSSHALGGFSKVWSGSILRPNENDLVDWPKESIPDSNDFKTIISSIKIAQTEDELSDAFPCGHEQKIKKNLKSVYLGRSRIAYISSISKNGIKSSLPFDTTKFFNDWSNLGLISYFKNQYITHLTRKEDGLYVHIEEGSRSLIKKYDFVFIGAGCINTTAIVDRSIYGEGERIYKIKSVPFLMQILLKVPFFNSDKEKILPGNDLYGLCKYFLENRSKATSLFWSHTQIGEINRIIIKKGLEVLPIKLSFLMRIIKKLFWFSITTFHSSLAQESILISRISKNNNIYNHSIKIKEAKINCTNSMYINTKYAIISKFLYLNLIPLPFSKFIDHRLRSNKLGNWHFGGTLPMKKKTSKPISCKSSGEISGLKGLFIIDTSTFPSIPGSTIGLLTMANAYRIAKNSL